MLIDLTGQRFGRLLVVKRMLVKRRGAHWFVHCDCGATKVVLGGNLRRGHITSCGCYNREAVSRANFIYGARRNNIYACWKNMHARCSNVNHKAFKNYGARGVTICERWNDFLLFARDMGERPKGTSIDRYPDNNGNYEPGNCRWATPQQQALNRRTTHRVTAFGETKSVSEWCEDGRCEVDKMMLYGRVYLGWDAERAMTAKSMVGWRKGIKGRRPSEHGYIPGGIVKS